MFSMLGKIFSSSQAQPVKNEPPSDSEDEKLEEIDERDEDSEDMVEMQEVNGGASEEVYQHEDVNGEEEEDFQDMADEETAYPEHDMRTPTNSATTSRNSSSKKRRTQKSKDEVEYPELPTTSMDDTGSNEAGNMEIDTELPSATRKKSKKSKKVNTEIKRLTRATSQMSDMEPAPVFNGGDEEDDDLDMVSMFNKKRRESSNARSIHPRRSKRKPSVEPEAPNVVTRSRQNSVELSTLPPKKTGKSKVQTTKFKSRGDIYDISEDDDSPHVSSTFKPHARNTSGSSKVTHASRPEASDTDAPIIAEELEKQQAVPKSSSRSSSKRKADHSTTQDAAEDEASVEISQKSLGKRKASKSDLESLSKKKQKRKSKRASSGTPPPLTAYGFSSDEPVRYESENEAENKIPDPSPEDLKSTAQRLFAEADSDSDKASPPPKASQFQVLSGVPYSVVSSAEMMDDIQTDSDSERAAPMQSNPASFTSPQAQRTTQWTPINSPVMARDTAKTVQPSSLTSSQIVLPIQAPLNPSLKPQVILPAYVPSEVVTSYSQSDSEVEAAPPRSNEKRKRQRSGENRRKRSSTSDAKPREPTELDDLRQTGDASVSEPANSTLQPTRSSTPREKNRHPEYARLARAVEMWRAEKNMTQYEINELIQTRQKKGQDDGGFWQHIHEQINNIERTQLHKLMRRLFHNFEARGTWSTEQDDELLRFHSLNPGKWTLIGSFMDRLADDCRDRWRNYIVCGNNQRKDSWDLEEEENLVVVVAECIELTQEGRIAAGEEYHENPEELINWPTVSEKMGYTRSRLQCSTKWKQLKERRSSEIGDSDADAPLPSAFWRLKAAEKEADRLRTEQKLHLLCLIRDTGAGHEAKIPWKKIQNELSYFVQTMTLMVCLKTMLANIHSNKKFQEVIDDLIEAYEAAAPDEPEWFYQTYVSSHPNTSAATASQRKKHSEVADDDTANDGDEDEGRSGVKKHKARSLSRVRITASDEESSNHDMNVDRIEGVESTSRQSKTRVIARSQATKRKIADARTESLSSPESQLSTPVTQSKRQKKKLRENMKLAEEKASQKLAEEPSSAPVPDDLEDLFDNMKNGMVRTPVQFSQPRPKFTEERFHESEDEQGGEQGVIYDDAATADESESSSDGDNEDIPAVIKSPEVIKTSNAIVADEESASDSSSSGDEDIPAQKPVSKPSKRSKNRAGDEESVIESSSEDEDDAPVQKTASRASEDSDVASDDENDNGMEDEDASLQRTKSGVSSFFDDRAADDGSEGDSEDGDQVMDERSESDPDDASSEYGDQIDREEEQMSDGSSFVDDNETENLSANEDLISKVEASEAPDDDKMVLDAENESQSEDQDASDAEDVESETSENEDLPKRVSNEKLIENSQASSESESESDSESKVKSPAARAVSESIDLDAKSDDEDEHKITMNGWGTPKPSRNEAESSEEDEDEDEDEDKDDDVNSDDDVFENSEHSEESEESEEEPAKSPAKRRISTSKSTSQATTPRANLIPAVIPKSISIVPPPPRYSLSSNITPRANATPRINVTPRANVPARATNGDGKASSIPPGVSKVVPPTRKPPQNTTPQVNGVNGRQNGGNKTSKTAASVASSASETKIVPPSRNSSTSTILPPPRKPVLPASRNTSTPILPPARPVQRSQASTPRTGTAQTWQRSGSGSILRMAVPAVSSASRPAASAPSNPSINPPTSTSVIVPPRPKYSLSQNVTPRASVPASARSSSSRTNTPSGNGSMSASSSFSRKAAHSTNGSANGASKESLPVVPGAPRESVILPPPKKYKLPKSG